MCRRGAAPWLTRSSTPAGGRSSPGSRGAAHWRAISVRAAAARGGSGVAVALRRRRPWRPAARAGFLPSGGRRRVRWQSWRVPLSRPLFSHIRWAAAHPAGTGRAWPCAVAAARAVKGKRTAVLGGAAAKGGAGPSAAAGAAAGTSGSERDSRSGDGDEASSRPECRQQELGAERRQQELGAERRQQDACLFFLFAKNALVPVRLSNRYQWMPKAPGEKPGVLD
ncbi:hypothetical protein PVAP13_8NG156703 [Panicum virgatum]|uniref:Uncharacterized protein n=1 Tax=Panicum virgatum TaxID=38727 RepID=A0A8T0PEY1_PANVG|nr:hypothetical protein PVAP13_8NG156703 [Panicum virgatum]